MASLDSTPVMLRPQVPASCYKRALPNISSLEALTRYPDKNKYKLLIFYDILTLSEISRVLAFYSKLTPRLRKFENIEIMLINN